MGCRWEELARHEAFKAGLEDGAVQRGEEEERGSEKSAVTRGRPEAGAGTKVVATGTAKTSFPQDCSANAMLLSGQQSASEAKLNSRASQRDQNTSAAAEVTA